MQPIQDSRISVRGNNYVAKCGNCSADVVSKYKNTVVRALVRGNCKSCKKDYRASNVDKNERGQWVSQCPKCGAEQVYTRQNHAKSSTAEGWLCRTCATSSKNSHVGAEKRLYNKFRKSANNRKISWGITFEEFVGCYTGRCALTGWALSMDYASCTASFDRIDSTRAYEMGNVQWVHTMVNMCKNKYPQAKFVVMCEAVAAKNKVKW